MAIPNLGKTKGVQNLFLSAGKTRAQPRLNLRAIHCTLSSDFPVVPRPHQGNSQLVADLVKKSYGPRYCKYQLVAVWLKKTLPEDRVRVL